MNITIIGGAGVRTVIFINGLLDRYKELNIKKVILFDIDQEKLEIISKICRYVIKKNDKDLVLEVCHDPIKAIKGADYIVTTLRVGGDHSRVIDETIALEQNVIGQETTGAGGFSMAARTIPVLLEYCKLIKEYAPQAWIFNFTNPSGLITQALRSYGYDRVIGICDAPSSTKFRMANYLDVEEKALYVEFVGLNHLSWIQSVKENGQDILQALLCSNDFLEKIPEFSMFDSQLLRQIQLLPNEYLYYYYHREKALNNILKSGVTRGEIIEQVNVEMMKELKAINIDENPEEALQIFLYYMEIRETSYMSIETGADKKVEIKKENLQIPDGIGYAGVMLDCIKGLQSETADYLVLSVENKGCIKELQDSDVIEVTCKVSKDGIYPVPIKELPPHCCLLIQNIKYYENQVVAAIKEKSKDKAIMALTLHPLVNSYSIAKKLVNKYEEAYGGLFK